MVKKQRERIDEDLIRNLIGGVDAPPNMIPKYASLGVTPETPPPENHDSPHTIPDTATSQAKPKQKPKKGTSLSEYETQFLHPRNHQQESTCRIASDTYAKLGFIARLLGGNVKAYVNNILDNHLEQYRVEISKLINNTKFSIYDEKNQEQN